MNPRRVSGALLSLGPLLMKAKRMKGKEGVGWSFPFVIVTSQRGNGDAAAGMVPSGPLDHDRRGEAEAEAAVGARSKALKVPADGGMPSLLEDGGRHRSPGGRDRDRAGSFSRGRMQARSTNMSNRVKLDGSHFPNG
jgi:hypothetical protein